MLTQYGKDYDLEAPVKLLDKLLHEMPQFPDEQIVVISQVLLLNIFLLMLLLDVGFIRILTLYVTFVFKFF